MKTILAIPGSLRKASFNRRLVDAAVELTPPGLAIEIYDELGMLPLFDEDLEAATDGGTEPVQRLRRRIAAADGLLIATPEYNQSIPGVLKNAIDWASRGADEVLAGKPVAVIGATPGRWGTRLAQAALRQTLAATEAVLLPRPMLFIADAASKFDRDGRLLDVATRDGLGAVLAAFARWIDGQAASAA